MPTVLPPECAGVLQTAIHTSLLFITPRVRRIPLPRPDAAPGGRQPAHTALMSVRFAEVTLSPPRHKAKLPALRLWVVRSREENPPPDSKPLDWMLLTTVPVASLDDALQRIQWYTRRGGSRSSTASSRADAALKIASSKPPTVWKPASPSTWSSPSASTISPGSGGPPPNCPVPSPSSPSSGRPWSSSTPASRRRRNRLRSAR